MNVLQPTIVRPFLIGAIPMALWVAYNVVSDLYAPPIEPNLDDTGRDLRVKSMKRYSLPHIIFWVSVFGLVNTLFFHANRWVMGL